jgi:hypothetical protein
LRTYHCSNGAVNVRRSGPAADRSLDHLARLDAIATPRTTMFSWKCHAA